jgi:hypothetical protein
MSSNDIQLIAWSGYSKAGRPNKVYIFVIFALLLTIAFFIGFFQKDIIASVFFVLAGVVVLILGYKKPKVENYEVGPSGVKIDDRVYRFSELKSFWVNYEPEAGVKELSLQLKKRWNSYVKIPINDQNPVQIRSVLLNFVPEEEHQDTLIDLASRRLGI